MPTGKMLASRRGRFTTFSTSPQSSKPAVIPGADDCGEVEKVVKRPRLEASILPVGINISSLYVTITGEETVKQVAKGDVLEWATPCTL